MAKLSRRTMMAAGAGAVPFLGLAAVARGQQGAQARSDEKMNYEDPGLAACLLIQGRKQIEVCKFALEKISHEDVKKFANAEIEEHVTLKKRLQELGYEYPSPVAGSREDRKEGVALNVGRAPIGAGAGRLIAIDHEVADQCIATTKAEQGKLQGVEFDKRFVGSQLDAHYALFDHGVVFRKHASAEMAPILDEARTIIERHIATCKELMARLEMAKGTK